ncbi:STAS domain-containing protein [Candidatus Uabimicrobium sp. HlEnr_7]|uniref:STAS domain-containing protein n=1 Tax=Candidatus Uabimicrobium helgolandensis TaxID=3095367 RepID=UPI0035574EF5
MSLSFKVEKEHLANGSTVTIAYLSGFIDIRTVKIFETESLNPLTAEGSKYLILNFSNVGYMNSTGLGVLVKVQDRYKESDGDLILVNVPQKIFDLFKMLGMDTILKVEKTNKDALDSLPFPLLPQIPDIPADSSEMLMESGDLLAPPPMDIPSNAVGGLNNIFMTPDPVSAPEPIVIPSPTPEVNENNEPGNIEFPAPDNFSGFNPFEVSNEDARIGEATSIDNEALGGSDGEESSGITISASDEFSNDSGFGDVTVGSELTNNLGLPGGGIEISDKSPGVSDTWEATVDESAAEEVPSLETHDSSPNNFEDDNISAEDEYDDEDDEFDEDDEDDMAISELDMTAEDDLDDIVDMEDHFRSGVPAKKASVDLPNPAGIDLGSGSNIEEKKTFDVAGNVEEVDISVSPVVEKHGEQTDIYDEEDESSAEMAVDEDFDEAFEAEEEDKEISATEPADLAPVLPTAATVPVNTIGSKGNTVVEEVNKESVAEKTFGQINEFGNAQNEVFDGLDESEKEKEEITNEPAEIQENKAKKKLEEVVTGRDEEDALSMPAEAISTNVTSQMPEFPSSEEKKEMEDIVDAVNDVEEEASQAIVAVSGTTEKMEQIEKPEQVEKSDQAKKPRVETYYKRKIVVRYYEKMNPLKSFPLLVAFSKEKLQKIAMDYVAQEESRSEINVKKSKPEVTVTPSLKGCTVYPPSMRIDISPEMTTAEFWVTPIVEGEIVGNIEIAYSGEVIENISVTSSCVKQTWAKVSALGAITIPMVSFLLEGLNWNLSQTTWNLIPKLIKQIEMSVGLSNFGVIMGGISIIAGGVMYSITKPKEADELEQFFSTN